jgi:hypothetical protein
VKWFTDSSAFLLPGRKGGGTACREGGGTACRNRDGSGRVRVLVHKETVMIRKLKTGEYRLYSRKVDPRTGKRRNLGTFKSREAAQKHEREVQYFKRH